MPLVIDANIAIAWFRPVVSKLADAALDALCEEGAIVPALWRWEVQDVLRRLADSGHLTLSVDAALHELRELPIDVDSEIAGLFGDERAIARTYGLSVYDSAYLEIAVRHAIPLATIDKKLASAAKPQERISNSCSRRRGRSASWPTDEQWGTSCRRR